MKTNIKKLAVATALTVALGYGATANAYVIDLFDDPAANGVQTVTDSNVSSASEVFMEYPGGATPSPTILGGYRDIISNLVGSNLVGTPTATSEVGGGGYSFSTSSGDTGIGKIQWDGKDNSAALNTTGLRNGGDAGLNFIFQEGCPTIGGCDRFVSKVLVADQGFQYQIRVYTDGSNYTVLTSNTLFPVGSPYIADYLFSWFALGTGDYNLGGLPFHIDQFGTGVDFTNVGAMELVINSDGGTVAVDLAIDSITKTSVPEPGSLALLGLGLAGMAALRRRKVF